LNILNQGHVLQWVNQSSRFDPVTCATAVKARKQSKTAQKDRFNSASV